MKYFILALLFLTGCAPYCYRARPFELACTDLEENVQRAFHTSSVCEGVYPNEEWWTFFQDPQLNRFIELSLACHPDIKIAQARIERALQEAFEARSALLPHFFFLGGITREKLSEFASRTQGNLNLQYITEATSYLTSAFYELDIWNKNRNKYLAALDEMYAQTAEYEEAKLILSTTIASVYFDLQYNMELLKISKERLQARKEVYDLLRQQFDNNVISEFNLYETDTEVQIIKDLILQQEAMVEIDLHALAALVGNLTCCCENKVVVEPAAIFSTPLPLPSTLPCDLLARRPDIMAQIRRVEAACLNVKVAKAQFFPTIDLLGFIGFASFELAEFFTKRAMNWILDAAVSQPLYTAGKLKAELGVAREDFEIAVEWYNKILLKAVQEVSDALTNLITADARQTELEKSVQDAKALYDLTSQKFINGVSDRIAVLNGLENLLIQKQLEVTVELDRYQAAVGLIQSIGGGYYDCTCQ